jgi:hypothetical protein
VSIVWPSPNISGKELHAFSHIIPHQLDLRHVFSLGGEAAEVPEHDSLYLFRGMVCYYGKHYVSFFQSQSKQGHWYLFDDRHVYLVGSWDQVRDRIERGCYQPTILFWEKEKLHYEQLERLAEQVHHHPHPYPHDQPPPQAMIVFESKDGTIANEQDLTHDAITATHTQASLHVPETRNPITPSILYLSIYLSIYCSIYLSIYLSITLSFYLFIYRSIDRER